MFVESSGDRPFAPNYLVLITDGQSNNRTATWREAMAARARAIMILAVREMLNSKFTSDMRSKHSILLQIVLLIATTAKATGYNLSIYTVFRKITSILTFCCLPSRIMYRFAQKITQNIGEECLVLPSWSGACNLIVMKLCAVVWGRKTKIEFVRGSKFYNAFPYFAPIFTSSNAFSMGRSKYCCIEAC